MTEKDTLDDRLDCAERLIREAGTLAMDYFRDVNSLAIQLKGDNDVATEADIAVEKFIRHRLAQLWPDDAFLGEETDATVPVNGQGVWVVDPIDGTACFVKGFPGWSISIAYFLDGEVEIGLVYDPIHDELFAARRGRVTTLNGQPVKCGDDTDFRSNLTGLGASHRTRSEDITDFITRLLSVGGMFHRNGSCALSLAYVACGRLNGYYEGHINSWDAFAGYLLVREGGGWTNNFITADTLLQGNKIAVSAPGIGSQMQAIIGPD